MSEPSNDAKDCRNEAACRPLHPGLGDRIADQTIKVKRWASRKREDAQSAQPSSREDSLEASASRSLPGHAQGHECLEHDRKTLILTDAGPRAYFPNIRDARVRDLCWAINPQNSILKEGAAVDAPDVQHMGKTALDELVPSLGDVLRTLDRDPTQLYACLEKHFDHSGDESHYVGKYFEALVSFAIRFASAGHSKVLLENHQVYSDRRDYPIGEVDLILETDAPLSCSSRIAWDTHGSTSKMPCGLGASISPESGARPSTKIPCLHHVELACKFYLITAEAEARSRPTCAWDYFIAPDGDSLSWKYAKMRDVQVRWSAKPPLRNELPGEPLPWIWMQGRFFRRFRSFAQPLGIVLELSASVAPLRDMGVACLCEVGWWCYIDEVASCLDAFDDQTYCALVLRKPYWLAPIVMREGEMHQDHGAGVPMRHLVSHLRRKHGLQALVAILAKNTSGMWIEAHRGFVVPRSWPDKRHAAEADASVPSWFAHQHL